jgi:hypothetical protein
MARLRWRSVQSSGEFKMEDAVKNHFLDFGLTDPDNSAAGLLIIAVKDVDHHKSFVTLNLTKGQAVKLDDMSLELAQTMDNNFVSTIFNTGSTYTWQIHRISPGILKGTNSLGIHARASDGTTAGNIDDFFVSRVFVVYTSTSE